MFCLHKLSAVYGEVLSREGHLKRWKVHPDPSKALSDGPQSLTFDAFDKLMADLKPYVDLAGRTFEAR